MSDDAYVGVLQAQIVDLRSQLRAVAAQRDRLDERRHELNELLTHVRAERDRARARVLLLRRAYHVLHRDRQAFLQELQQYDETMRSARDFVNSGAAFRFIPPVCSTCGLSHQLVRKFNNGNPIEFWQATCNCDDAHGGMAEDEWDMNVRGAVARFEEMGRDA